METRNIQLTKEEAAKRHLPNKTITNRFRSSMKTGVKILKINYRFEGNKTICKIEAVIMFQITVTASAKCCPGDIFDPEIGKKLAYKRARMKLMKKAHDIYNALAIKAISSYDYWQDLRSNAIIQIVREQQDYNKFIQNL